jgi:hypothetical protein
VCVPTVRGSPMDQRAPRSALAGCPSVGTPAGPCAGMPAGAPVPINLHTADVLAASIGIPTVVGSGREGARAIPTILEARLRPAGGAPGSTCDQRAGAQEKRRSTALPCPSWWRAPPATEWRRPQQGRLDVGIRIRLRSLLSCSTESSRRARLDRRRRWRCRS